MKIRVWDLPVRVFHWALAALVVTSIVTIKLGDAWFVWHVRSGCAILALLLFRLVWGFVGGHYDRFLNFPVRPKQILNFLSGASPTTSPAAGHNPLGSLSILAMLLVFLLQAVSGLFSNDDVDAEGPLAVRVSKRVSDQFSSFHSFNAVIVYVLLGLHVGAITYYFVIKRRNLVAAMISGDVEAQAASSTKDNARSRMIALCIFAACAALVWVVVANQPAPMGE